MNPLRLVLALLLVLGAASSAGAQSVMYIDEAGNIYHVHSIEQVPAKYRHQVEPKSKDNVIVDQKAYKKYLKEQAKLKKKKEKEELRKQKQEEAERKKQEKKLQKELELKAKEEKKNAKKIRRPSATPAK